MFDCRLVFITISLLNTINLSVQQQSYVAYGNIYPTASGDSFKFITLPQEQHQHQQQQQQQQSTHNQLNYQQQFQFGQQLQNQQQQQQQYQQPSIIQQHYGNENSKQYLTQTMTYQQQPLQQQQQQHHKLQYYPQQQQQPNVYQFQSLPNTNQHTNNQQTNSNQNQNHIQTQQYLQVPSTVDGETSSHTNQQQFYYPHSYAALAKSQQQQRQQQQQQQSTQFNHQKIQRISPEYEYASKSSSLPLSTGIQPTSSDMSTAYVRRLVPTQQQQRKQQHRSQLSVQRQSQQIFSKPSRSNVDNNTSDFLPSYFSGTNESTSPMQATCTRCCQLNQNPCLECCSEQPYLSATTLKLLAG